MSCDDIFKLFEKLDHDFRYNCLFQNSKLEKTIMDPKFEKIDDTAKKSEQMTIPVLPIVLISFSLLVCLFVYDYMCKLHE